MRLGGTRSAAAAIAPCLAAQQHHHVPRRRNFTADVFRGSRANHRADLHALGEESVVVNFVHKPRRKADLVAVGAVARRRGGDDLSLRQLARQRLGIGPSRVCGAGEAHRLIDKRAARQRVSNRATDAGRGPAKGLDLRRVIVRFVFKEHEPVLLLTVDQNRGLDRAGVDLVGFVKVFELSFALEPLGGNGRHVHQRHRLTNAEAFAQGKICFVCFLCARIEKLHRVQLR